jgi:hypothetical protein
LRFSFVIGKVREIAKTPTPLPSNETAGPPKRDEPFHGIEAGEGDAVAFRSPGRGPQKILVPQYAFSPVVGSRK